MKTCVINFARGGWYPKGQVRLKQSFLNGGYDGDFLFFSNERELNCPSHSEMPYAFKAYAFQRALSLGYTRLIWADAAVFLIGDLNKIYQQLDSDGYMLVLNGWNTGQWCSDAALKILGITREMSFTIPHIMANLMGFDTKRHESREFLKRYFERAKDGSFRGAWTNKRHQVSKDSRVLGHRHDQTAASVIAWRLCMTNLLKNWVAYKPKIDEQSKRTGIVFLTCPAK